MRLRRYRFKVGEWVEHKRDGAFQVEARDRKNGENVYMGNEGLWYAEENLVEAGIFLNYSIEHADDPASDKKGKFRSVDDVKLMMGEKVAGMVEDFFGRPYDLRLVFHPDDLQRWEIWHHQTQSLREIGKAGERVMKKKGLYYIESGEKREFVWRFKDRGFKVKGEFDDLERELDLRIIGMGAYNIKEVLMIEPVHGNRVKIKFR